MQIRYKLFFGYLGLTVLVVLLGLHTIFSTESNLKTLESGGSQYRPITQAANEVSSYAKRAQGHLMLYLTLNDPADKEKFYTRYASMLEQTKIIRTKTQDIKVNEYADQIETQSGDLLLVGQSLLDAYEKDPKLYETFDFKANAQTVQELDKTADNIRQLGADLANYEIDLQDTILRASISQNKLIKQSIVILLFILIIIANLIAFLLSRSILKPIDRLKESVQKIARGDRTVQTDIRNHDEMGTLAKAFNLMAHEVDERRSELELLHEEERKQRIALEEESKARAQFINVLAHEMRTPLTPLMISIETIGSSLNSPPGSTQHKLINTATNSIQTLKNRLEELLELARFTRGAFKLNIHSIDTAEMVQRICESYLPVLEKKNQRLEIETSYKLPTVEADLSRLEQVFLNLLSNASKFAPPDSEIRVKVTIQNNQLQIEIIDQGIGISEEDQKKLFMPYHQVEQDRQQFPGIGLGLAVSKEIIEAHRGRIWVESGLGKGCKFIFVLPLSRENLSG
jgi:signal transduction histidine kinase